MFLNEAVEDYVSVCMPIMCCVYWMSVYFAETGMAGGRTTGRDQAGQTLFADPEKGSRKRGSEPYLFSCCAPNEKCDKLSVTFS